MNICIIGAGASGCVCAIELAKNGHSVTLYEKNEKIGKKLYITGKGRCNLTNATTGNIFLQNVVHGSKFILSAETRFNSSDTMAMFTSFGVPLKIERGNRVFPQSDKSSDIIHALDKQLKLYKVNLNLNTPVQEIVANSGKIVGVKVNNKTIPFDAVIVATGGKSYPATGSTGDGYKFAESVGHQIIEPVPSLVAIDVYDKDIFSLQGLTLKNISITAYKNNKPIYFSPIGELLFTGTGISGPLVLSASAHVNRVDIKDLSICIDFKPALNLEAVEGRISRDIQSMGAKQISSLLEGLLPKSLCGIFANRLGINMTDRANQLSRSQRSNLAIMLKNFKLQAKHLEGFDHAVITSGGVSTKQIDPSSMQSKLVKGLYFIGEVLDIDALTGGFNLQLAFSTAMACASNIR